MELTATSIEVNGARWDQFVGAVLRAERLRALVATARPRRRRRVPARACPCTRASFVWMLAASLVGLWALN